MPSILVNYFAFGISKREKVSETSYSWFVAKVVGTYPFSPQMPVVLKARQPDDLSVDLGRIQSYASLVDVSSTHNGQIAVCACFDFMLYPYGKGISTGPEGKRVSNCGTILLRPGLLCSRIC